MIKINGKEFEQKTFPDGTPLLKFGLELTPDYLKKECVITWLYENMSELFNLQCIVKSLKNATPTPIGLVMPYVPNARQDRVQNEEKDVFTLKWFCGAINDLKFSKVLIVDAHSTVTPALLNNCQCISNQRIFNNVIHKRHIDLAFYPDNGASKKYSEHIKFPYAFGIKKRDWETGKITGLEVAGDVKDKDILIVDDISSYGGTFLHSAKALKELGAKSICLLVTHCENTILDGELIKSGLIDKIYTTNSIYTGKNDLIEVIEWY